MGLEAASWRYTGKPSSELTWAEAAAMAVLPNSPSLVFPGRNKEILKARRDRLLQKLYERKYIDSLTLLLALEEPIPSEPGLLPAKAQHLTDHFSLEKKGERIKTTIDPNLQERANAVMNRHQKDLSSNFIFNSACIIVRVETGEVMAYIGNSNLENSSLHGGDVDIIKSLRSTGSILKPLLYTGMLNSGDILPNTLIADVPTRFPGFSPKNFDHSYSGAVPAGAALSQSLNIPAVKMLQKFSPEKFLDLLRLTGFTTFKKNSDYYGLSLILGGGETSLWELTGVYASMSRVLKRYNKEKKYSPDDYHPPVLLQDHKPALKTASADIPPLSASSIWLTYEALRKVNRPESESGWQYFNSSLNLAWKTGTSFGFRDAWAVGTTSEFVIGVWAGNCDGEGRPGLTGITAAAPVLFELAGLVDQSSWFDLPLEDLTMIKVCTKSGFRTGPDCPESIEIPACVNGLRSEACPWHTIIHLNKSGTMQVNTDCASPSEIINVPWFILPPAMEYFYRIRHAEYRPLPPIAPGCGGTKKIPVMEFIYPTAGIKIFIPRDQTGELTNVISEIAHRDPGKKIFWHLDEIYLGTTDFLHQMDIQAKPGKHILTTVDEDGNTLSCFFYIADPPG